MKRNSVNNSRNFNSIEKEISEIFNSISSTLNEGLAVKKVKPAKGATYCKGMIKIYNKEELKREEKEGYPKAKAVESYSFYASTFKPTKIGSVAIYGENAFNRCVGINKSGFLFGRRVVSANMEQGLRPFVDVQLVV